ncbi:MAG: N-6 DNA methylase [Armatimonadota bacterium]|nr:N-6 DNA methylase [bacterium]
MQHHYELVQSLTSCDYSSRAHPTALRDFARQFGWHPSYQLDIPSTSALANTHLVVEHGLENTAVITFLKSPKRYADLRLDERMSLLSISYNNLVDWHIHVQPDEATFVFNRSNRERVVQQTRIEPEGSLDVLCSQAFEQICGRKPNPNVPALDDALVNTVSYWKRNLAAELNNQISNDSISALFNAIMFVRAAEDHQKLHSGNIQVLREQDETLLGLWEKSHNTKARLGEFLISNLGRLSGGTVPSYLVRKDDLCAFDDLSQDTVSELLADFYQNKYEPQYRYDFSLISKHALSRIYEHYVSVLHLEETPQKTLPFFKQLPEEERDKAYGSVYTPQFIARFFARYLREQMPPRHFRNLRVIDPACGSGIFLRTLLEMQCDPAYDEVDSGVVEKAFENTVGLDLDMNACQATCLSLALLNLILTERLPSSLNVVNEEAISYYQQHSELKETYDAVIANPPFVALGAQSPVMRQRIADFMHGYAEGRIDTFVPFLRIGLELLKPGGIGMFVLPHSFLLSRNARKMRRLITDNAWICCLADLSAIRVFQDAATYVVLLIFQKKSGASGMAPHAKIIKCRELVGRALEEAVEGRQTQTPEYSIYEADQSTFAEDDWLVLPPTESIIKKKLTNLPKLEDFLCVREGFLSGADDVFIIPTSHIPKGEESIYVPFLHDREMRAYTVPECSNQCFFYPYIDGRKITEDELKEHFPATWRYLCGNESTLSARRSCSEKHRAWWEPVRPRLPQNMMLPKIVSPHLSLVPRFALDTEGVYAVSHSPLLYPKDPDMAQELLRFFVAVLNSTVCYWHVAAHSHTYARGYAMLEPKTLKPVPVPDPFTVPPANRRRLLQLVDSRLACASSDAIHLERQIDDLVAEMYGLSSAEYKSLGIDM